MELQEINNLELISIKQNKKEGIRAFVGRLEAQARNCNLVIPNTCGCGCNITTQVQAAPLFIRQALIMNMSDHEKDSLRRP